MSYSVAQEGGIIPMEAGVDLVKGQLVKMSGTTVVVCTASDEPIGAVTEDFLAGSEASIAMAGAVDGFVWLIADGVIALGARIKPAAAGRVASAGAAGSETGLLVARCAEAGTAQGELIKCALLTPVTES